MIRDARKATAMPWASPTGPAGRRARPFSKWRKPSPYPSEDCPRFAAKPASRCCISNPVYRDADQPSVALHDPTAAKKFPLFDTNPDGSATGLNKIPSSIQTSIFRGKTYFPRLSPHLAERFYFDPNDSKNGSLVLVGEFKNEALGESYLQPNFLSQKDILALKELCSDDDESKAFWDQAIDNSGSGGLTLQLETFYPNPAKPGTFTSTIEVGGLPVHQAVEIHVGDLAEVKHSDTAVDSYALTAIGPGTGYVSIIAGQGMAFTPPEEPVSIKIIKVVDTLYRGEVKVILSSNPLAEKVTMQQVVDLAGKVENYDFEWWIAAPSDGAPPAVYGNTTTNLLFSGSPDPWHHLHHPLAFGYAGIPGSSRLCQPFPTIRHRCYRSGGAGARSALHRSHRRRAQPAVQGDRPVRPKAGTGQSVDRP
jgi:hypothetical protein